MTPTGIAAVPWIRTVDPEAAGGLLAEAYASQVAKLGRVTELTQLGSLYPELVAERLRLYAVVESAPSSIPDWGRRAIALTVSELNGCLFCTEGNIAKLREAGHEAIADAISADPRGATTGDPAVDALLAYTRRLTLDPASVAEAHVETLRAAGWDDLAILDANNLAAYYGYVNRVAAGLGLNVRG
jgi:uncharacterized peroxidase-related enzyme